MSNLIAVMTHCGRGEEMIVGSEAHVLHYEAGGAAGVASVLVRTAQNGPRGDMDAHEVESLMRGENVHVPRTALLCLENTHNRRGGATLSAERTRELAEVARRHGAAVHIDGARIFNAALAQNTTVAALAEPADSVGFCLSKGLGAPVGSVLCGAGGFIGRARKNRKMLGGGMRQAGIIAAAGIYALECMVERLAEDHANAKALARGLAELPMVELDPASVETNIVIFGVADSVEFARALKREGVLCTMPRPGHLRMVTHYGIEKAHIDEALERVRTAAAALV
jgi:threonine aldolase